MLDKDFRYNLKIHYLLWISNVLQPIETLMCLIFAALRACFPIKSLMLLNIIYATPCIANTLLDLYKYVCV